MLSISIGGGSSISSAISADGDVGRDGPLAICSINENKESEQMNE